MGTNTEEYGKHLKDFQSPASNSPVSTGHDGWKAVSREGSEGEVEPLGHGVHQLLETVHRLQALLHTAAQAGLEGGNTDIVASFGCCGCGFVQISQNAMSTFSYYPTCALKSVPT